MYKHKILNGCADFLRTAVHADFFPDYQEMVRKAVLGSTELNVEMTTEEYDSREFFGFSHCATGNLLISISSQGSILGAVNVVRMDKTTYRMYFILIVPGGKLFVASLECIEFSVGDGGYRILTIDPKFSGVLSEYEQKAIKAASFVIQIMDCKSLVKRKISPVGVRAQGAGKSSGRLSPFEYYVLEIDPAFASEAGADGDGTGTQKRLHLCRGHWSEYTEKAPLFGKYVGRFWIPEHKRGQVELGKIIKDYRLDLTRKPEAGHVEA